MPPSLPLILCRPKVTQPQVHPPPPLTYQDETFFRITFPYPFLPQLTSQKASSWLPFGHPNRPKIVPRHVLRRDLFENADFQNILRFPIENLHFRPQGAAKIDPRSPQDCLKTVLTCNRFFDKFLHKFLIVFGPSWLLFGRPKPPQNRPKSRP